MVLSKALIPKPLFSQGFPQDLGVSSKLIVAQSSRTIVATRKSATDQIKAEPKGKQKIIPRNRNRKSPGNLPTQNLSSIGKSG
jgi:hypothetical protein